MCERIHAHMYIYAHACICIFLKLLPKLDSGLSRIKLVRLARCRNANFFHLRKSPKKPYKGPEKKSARPPRGPCPPQMRSSHLKRMWLHSNFDNNICTSIPDSRLKILAHHVTPKILKNKIIWTSRFCITNARASQRIYAEVSAGKLACVCK